MPQSRSRRGLPDSVDFEGTGDDARAWLDAAYGTSLRLTGPLGTVQHHGQDHGSVAFDHIRIDAAFDFGSDPLPGLVVVDMLRGATEFTRAGVTDRVHDGESVLVAGWNMPFTGSSEHHEIRTTTLSAEVVKAAVLAVAPGFPWQSLAFTSYVPRSAAAAARWRATVDHLSSDFPTKDDPVAHGEASRLLGYTLLQAFPNNLVAAVSGLDVSRDPRGESPSTVHRALRVIESHDFEDLTLDELAQECGVTPRALQYAFRRHLGCTPLAYVRRIRLDLARQSLRGGSALSVGDAAARYGFFNPGRFASDYRQVFNENPGQTLQRSSN